VNWVKNNVSDQESKEVGQFLKTWQPSYNSLTCDSFLNSELSDTKWLAMRNHGLCRLKNVDLNNRDQLIFRYTAGTSSGTWSIHLDKPGGDIIASVQLPATKSWEITQIRIRKTNGIHDVYFSYTNNGLKTPEENGALFDWFYFTDELPGKDKQGYSDIRNEYWQLATMKLPSTPVMMDNPDAMHRGTNVFERGNWLVKGDKVEPDVPHSLNPLPAGAPHNRMGLAQWMVAKENPLTARTMVNRVWEQLFGNGLAETLEDLGSQGIVPTHPELLDWLSYNFMTNDKWSVKNLVRQIVMSATYQQDSKLTADMLEKDPYNKYYARGARVRLSAEQIRDQALCISGVFCDSMYGPSVFPWQPKGIWLSPWNGATWQQSKGAQQYRRAMYTYWKRSAGYPSMINFDGVSREVCTSRRIRTNTPLQALNMLNDSVYIDLARHLAKRMDEKDIRKSISKGFEWATLHPIDEKSLQTLSGLYNTALDAYKREPEKSKRILGEAGGSDPALAALTIVANAILNLDEVVTKN
jgi:hypothetical protein